MHMVVLVKQVLDPEMPARAFAVNKEQRTPDVPRPTYVLSVFDGNALEVALKLREARGGGQDKITLVSLGPKGTEEMLRKGLALQADAAVHVSHPEQGLDSLAKARVLAAAIRKLDAVDLVLAGRQAADWEAGQVGAMVAEELGLPCVPCVNRVEPDDTALKLRQELDDGYQVVRLPGPGVVTVTNDETNVLRLPKVKDVMMAMRKPITTWGLNDLGIDPAGLADPAVEVVDLSVPAPRNRAEVVEGETAAEKARNLAQRMRELNVI